MFSESAQQAQCETAELKELITEILRSNPGFAKHGATYVPPIAEELVASSSQSISSVGTESSAKRILRPPAFESILGKTRVYRRANRNTSTNSFNTTRSSWSELSGLSLADISDISVIRLPVYLSELSNADLYQQERGLEEPKTTGMASGKQMDKVRQASGRIRTEVWYRLRVANGVTKVELLHEAAGKGYVEIVRTMLQNREVHENATDSSGATAIHHSALHGHPPTLQLLLDMGANIDAATKDGSTALHYSAEQGDHGIVLLLLDRGANVDAATDNGRTALHHSAQ